VDDDKDQVLQSPITQASGSLMQNQASTSSQVQQDQQMASSSSPTHDQHQHPSNQVQVLQPTNIARDHTLDSIIGDIQRGVQLDQDWHHFMLTLLLCQWKNPRTLIKH
jgi:hypothetical protein